MAGRRRYVHHNPQTDVVTELVPMMCPVGHELAIVGHRMGWLPCPAPCGEHGGHRAYECGECGQPVYDPPHEGAAYIETWDKQG